MLQILSRKQVRIKKDLQNSLSVGFGGSESGCAAKPWQADTLVEEVVTLQKSQWMIFLKPWEILKLLASLFGPYAKALLFPGGWAIKCWDAF